MATKMDRRDLLKVFGAVGAGSIAGCYTRDDSNQALIGGGGGGDGVTQMLDVAVMQLEDGESFSDLTDSSFDVDEALVFASDLSEYRIWRSN